MKIRVLLAKPGLDGHDAGVLIVARALRDAGMEVIYTGLRQTPEMIAKIALQEDIDVLGLSNFSGAHLELFPEVMKELEKHGLEKIIVIASCIIQEEEKDIPPLKEAGIRAVFGPGSTTKEVIEYIQKEVKR